LPLIADSRASVIARRGHLGNVGSNEWIGFMTTSQTCTVSSGSLTGYDAGGSSH
jgi:hypothetical protein